MAEILTFDSLKAKIVSYTKRTDAQFIAQLPFFIMLAQQQLAKDLKITGVKQMDDDKLIIGNFRLQKPNNWLNTSDFYIKVSTPPAVPARTRFKPVFHRSFAFCRMYWPNPTDRGEPKYFCDDVEYNNFFFFPTPDVDYDCQFVSFVLPDLIDENISTNYFTQYAPNSLLFGCLIQAYSYLENQSQITEFSKLYVASIRSLTTENIQRISDGFSNRSL